MKSAVLLDYLTCTDYPEVDFLYYLKMKNQRSGQSSILSDKEYLKIRSAISNSKFKLLFDIAWYTGERWGAIVQLRKADIVNGHITFRASTRKASPSGMKETRQVPIHSSLAEIIKSYRFNAKSEWIFYNNLNQQRHVSLRAVDIMLRSALVKAGLSTRGISTHSTHSTHSTRRSFITKLHRCGVDLYTIQGITGHKDLQSLRRYVEISPERISNAINLI